jgi:L-ribulose-5-phosphate 4-epimerase
MKDIKQKVYEANLELVRRNLVIYTWGNVSAIDREKKLVVIKPRGVEYSDMTADDMVTVDLAGNRLDGHYFPSVDLDIHLAMYEGFPEVVAIAHTHSTYATVWSQAGQPIPVLGTTHADHFYGPIPCSRPLTDEELEGNYERHTGKSIVEALAGRDPMQVYAALVAGHGPFTWGDSPEQAVEHSVILEEVARMAKATVDINPQIQCISQKLLDRHFLRKHGASAYFYQHQGSR